MKAATLKKLVKLADGHRKADEYKSGHYSWDGGACAIGCTIRDAEKIGIVPKGTDPGDHAALAAANGVPELAWRLCDHIFEGLPSEERSKWPPRFLRAIKPDADYTHFPARVMARCAEKLAADALTPEIKTIATTLAGMWRCRAAGDDPPKAEWQAIERQADAASRQAEAARRQAEAASRQAEAAWWQADAASRQADAASRQAGAASRQAEAASRQAEAARRQAEAARRQAGAARRQAEAARYEFWRWLADVVCEELQR